MIGKKIRLDRISDKNSGKFLTIPIDHGMSDGPIEGLNDIRKTVSLIAESGASGIIMHKGIVERGYRGYGSDIGLIVHLSAGNCLNPDPLSKVVVTTVEEAVNLGADAVSSHINLGAKDSTKMIEDTGRIVADCKRYGIPLLVMIYPRGEKVKDEKDVKVVKIAARVAAELGADIVKCPYTGSKKSFKEVVDGCPVPVIIAGGSKGTDIEVLRSIKDAMDAGAAGVSMGRNSFQHKNPKAFILAISHIVNKNMSVDDAIKKAGLETGNKKRK